MSARSVIRRLLPVVAFVLVAFTAFADPLPVGRDTLKARLGDKASDGQRVNDCRVPVERRKGSKRPSACAPRERTAGG